MYLRTQTQLAVRRLAQKYTQSVTGLTAPQSVFTSNSLANEIRLAQRDGKCHRVDTYVRNYQDWTRSRRVTVSKIALILSKRTSFFVFPYVFFSVRQTFA